MDGDLLNARQSRREQREEQLEQRIRGEDAERGAGNRERKGLEERLAHQRHARGAERGTNGEFSLPARGARQQKVGQIHAADQEQRPDRTQQHPESRPDLRCKITEHRLHKHADIGIGLRKFARQISGNDTHLGAGLIERHARAQTAGGEKAEVHAVAEVFRRVVERFPKLEFAAGVVEVRRHHAENLGLAAVEADLAAGDGGIAA